MSVLHVAAWARSTPPPGSALPVRIDPTALDAIPILAVPEEMLSSTDPEARERGARELVAIIERDWPDDHRRTFLVALTPVALESAVQHCIPPSVTVAQAVLESGWGRSGLAKRHNNLFGIKSGSAENGVALKTREVVNATERMERHRFRRFEDWSASVTHHNQLLENDPRYAAARPHWDHWPTFIAAIGPVYASDPAYVSRVAGLVRQYRLDEWDAQVRAVAVRRGRCTF